MGSSKDQRSHNLAESRRSLMSEIGGAFEGISLEGGITWNEAEAIDAYATPEVQSQARARDIHRRWQDLANDSHWPAYDCPASWSHLDPIGFRYYLPAALIREVQTTRAQALRPSLNLRAQLDPQRLANLDQRQLRALERVAKWMVADANSSENPDEADGWRDVLKTTESLRRQLKG